MINLSEEINNINSDWKEILLTVCKNNNSYINNLQNYLIEEGKLYDNLIKILPPKNLIFNCFNYFNFNKLKVVILGQDPYHGINQAMGLSFSVGKNIKLPPSLKRIYKEIESDLNIAKDYNNGDLTNWAKQGVLLLNTALTVREGNPGSHSKIWIEFTNEIIKYINEHSEGIVFLLWGNHAKKYKSFVDLNKHYCLEASHPSPLARNGWFGCKHFSKTNEILKNNNKSVIDWN